MNTQPETRPAISAVRPVSADLNSLPKGATMRQTHTDLAEHTRGPWARHRRTPVATRARQLGVAVAAVALLIAPTVAPATQLDLAQSPLFLSGTVQPNILFLTDDSGSMDWNMVTTEAEGVMYLTAGGVTTKYTYLFPQSGNNFAWNDTNGRILPSEAAVAAATDMPDDKHGVWRGRFSGYNTLYYNPDVTYVPWEGVDAAGVPFGNASPTAARLNPYVATGGVNVVNLTTNMSWTADDVPTESGTTPNLSVTNYYPAQYYTWTDSDNDGVVDAADGHTLVEIKTSKAPFAHTLGTRTQDCGVGSTTCTYTQELQNFANWFQYYRRRILTSKSAVGAVIAPSSARMGFATLNDNGSVDTLISSMNASVSSGNKKALLDAVYENFANGGTPLRTKLDEAGKYFECVSGNIFGLTAGSTSCPILEAASGGACQKNFTVLMTDGYYNDSFTFGTTPYNKDGGTSDSSFDGGAYKDAWDNTLADIAMHYYERDLSLLPNDVFPVPGVDIATHQHMATYTVAFGVTGTLTANPPNTTSPFAWPDPGPGTANAEKIDDLRHAAYNGRGKFLSAKSPLELRESLGSALGHITGLLGSASSVAVNSHILSTTTTIYQARFTSGEWSGDLRALPVSTSGAIGSELWSASTQLKAQNWNTGRRILTHNGTKGVAFRWTSLTAAQKALLNVDPASMATDTRGSDRLDWLRGDASKETTSPAFRRRLDSYGAHFKLGDLINSSPVYVGPPRSLPDTLESSPHSSFSAAFATRANVIYVGGNDGMLHGFDAATGNELLAYVPATLLPNLNKLTDPAYLHRYYVDGSPVSGDVFGTFDGCSTSPCWRTVLVSGLGAGGKGYFALDITDPSMYSNAETVTNAGKIVLWEFPGDADLGYTFSQPTITKVKTSATAYKWVAIFGNGYNSTNESAALYVVDMENGSLVRKIVVDTGGGTSSNGLSTPAVYDNNGDYIADYVYAGDLKGNLWKFDLTTGDAATWSSSYGTAGAPQPLFRAVDATGVAQPITERPAVGKPGVLGGAALTPTLASGTMVYFGTGRYVSNADKIPPANPDHTFYGIWDSGVASATVPVTRNDLLPQTIDPTTATITTSSGSTIASRNISNTAIIYRQSGSATCEPDGSGECLGWRVDLPLTGEMSVANPVLLTTDNVDLPRIIFPTLVPGTDACSAGGTSWLMELNPIVGGLLSSPYVDTNGDGVINGSDTVVAGFDLDIGIVQEPVVIYDPAQGLVHKVFSGSTGAVANAQQEGDKTPPSGPSGTPGAGKRSSWRQIK